MRCFHGVVTLTWIMAAALAPAAALRAQGEDAPLLAEGFLAASIQAQQALKGFNQPGNFTVGGFLGVGTDAPARSVHLQGRNAVFRMDRDVNSSAFLLVRTAPGNFNSIWKTFVVGANADGPGNGSFLINDLGAAVSGGGTRRLTIDDVGNFGINTAEPESALDVHGTGVDTLLTLSDGDLLRLFVTDLGLLAIADDFFLAGNAALNQRIQVPGDDGGALTGLLQIRANSGGLWYITDANNDSSPGFLTHEWFDGGTASGNIQMALDQGPNATLFVDGPVQQNTAFDLAESFWKGDDTIRPGHVVRVDPRAPAAVLLTDREADPTVLGVVSTAPGFILGGGAFSLEQLKRVWGEEIAAIFENERDELEAAAFAKFDAVRELDLLLSTFEGFRAKHTGSSAETPQALDKLRTEYEEQRTRLAREIERITLDLFFEKHFVRLALAGRVPVKVDAAYGAVEIGDLLVASPTPGHVMRADDPEPGTIVGKALQPLTAGTGDIMMMVMLR